MAGLSSLIEMFPQLAPVANALGFKKEVLVGRDFPEINELEFSKNREKDQNTPLWALPKSTQPQALPKTLEAYRADPTGRYGGKEGLETQPLQRLIKGGNTVGKTEMYKPDENPETSTVYTDPSKAVQELYKYARLNGAAAKHGYPAFTPEEIVAFTLKEGRTDLGHSGVNFGNKQDVAYDKMLRNTYHLPAQDLNFLAAVASKKRVADKLGISLAEAWNGTGVNDAGKSGKDYAADWEAHKKAALHPKNKQLFNVIQKGIDEGQKYGLPSKDDQRKDSPRVEKVPYKKGGPVDKSVRGGGKLI